MQSLRACLVASILSAGLTSPLPAGAQDFFDLQQKFGSTTTGVAEQGFSVAISADGNTALVGGPRDNGGAGGVWVFTRSGGAWTQQGPVLVGSGAVGSNGASQGWSVALSTDGNTALIGGPADSNQPNEGSAGAAWVFVRSNGVWTQQGDKLVGSGGAGDATQGYAVALSGDGNTALLGGPTDNSGVGATWVFTRSGNAWTQQGDKLGGSAATGNSEQGFSVALSGDGNTALIGGPADGGTSGAVWVFSRTNGVWSQQGGKLVGSGGSGYPGQGFSVALSPDGNTAIEGGPYDNGKPATGGTGAVWVFDRSNGVWTQQGDKLVGTGTLGNSGLGYAVALSASTMLIGGPFDGGDPVTGGAGAAWVFTLSNGVWTQQGGKIIGAGAVGFAAQGASVALAANGSAALVGGPTDNDRTGATWAYVPASAFNLNQHGMTGSWFDTSTAGQGVEVEVYPDLIASGTGFLQAAWFTYDYTAPGDAASQRWYTFSGEVQTAQPSAMLTLYQNTGGNFNTGPPTTAMPVGMVTFSATDCNHVSMVYSFNDGSGRSGTVPMTRLLPNVTCVASGPESPNSDFGYSGNWFSNLTPGQGIVLELNPNQPLAWLTWYTYAPNGQSQGAAGQRWYTAQQPYEPGARSVTMTLYESTGGLFDKSAPSPTTVPVGTVTATFTSCTALRLDFSFTAGSSAGTMGTIVMTRVGPVPSICGH